MLNSNDVSEYLKISPTGLEVAFFVLFACFGQMYSSGAADYAVMELFIQTNRPVLPAPREGDGEKYGFMLRLDMQSKCVAAHPSVIE